MANNQITTCCRVFRATPLLRELDFSGNPLREFRQNVFRYLNILKKLSMSGNVVQDPSGWELTKNCEITIIK